MTGDPVRRVVILEFPDEAEAYVDQCQRQGLDAKDALIISLDPKVRLALKRKGLDSVSTLTYFTPDAHAAAVRKAHELVGWLEKRACLEDSLGVKEPYNKALSWYGRYFIHHLLWHSQFLGKIVSEYPDALLLAPTDRPNGNDGPMIQDDERYLGVLAEDYCRRQGYPFEGIELLRPPTSRSSRGAGGFLRQLAYRLARPLHRAALSRMGRHRPLWVRTHAYRMDALVQQARQVYPTLPWVVQGEGGGKLHGAAFLRRVWEGATAGIGNPNGSLFMGEVWEQILAEAAPDDRLFSSKLELMLENLNQAIDEAEELFSYNGVFFGEYVKEKINRGIAPTLRLLQREVWALNEALSLLRPRLVVSPAGRRFHQALSDLSEQADIPVLLVSHGSFTPVKSELEEMCWAFHSDGLFHGPNLHSALQTPQAEAFANQLTLPGHFVRTGPLAWGSPVNRTQSKSLKNRLLPLQPDSRVIVHASTPKARSSLRFHIYETLDEYIEGIKDLVLAVEEVPEAFLIVKFRPGNLTTEELLELLPKSDRFTVSVTESFLDVLGIADLLVSFSSTTIEEALQNRVPVLQYGGLGRYQHIEAFEVTPDIKVPPRAVYAVRQQEYLSDALRRILANNGNVPLPDELFQEYTFQSNQIPSFADLAKELASG